MGLGVAAGLVVAGWAWWRIKKFLSGDRHQDPLLIKEKVTRLAYDAQVEVTAILSEHGDERRAQECCATRPWPTRATTIPPGPASRRARSDPSFPKPNPFRRPGACGNPVTFWACGNWPPWASLGQREPAVGSAPQRLQDAVPVGQSRVRRCLPGRHGGGQAAPGPPAEGRHPAQPVPGGPHPHGQVHADAPRGDPPDAGEGGREEQRRHNRR